MSDAQASAVPAATSVPTAAPHDPPLLHRRQLLAHTALAGAALIGAPREAAAAGPPADQRQGAARASGVHNVLDYGAVRDELSTAAIQRAVDACHEAGGGRVLVPPGTFVIGTVVLKSRVNLHLERGAELLSSDRREDFISTFRRHGMIFCEDAQEISITGEGAINGGGSRFYDAARNHATESIDRTRTRQGDAFLPLDALWPDGPIARAGNPSGFTIEFYHCTQVTLRDVTIRDTPIWATRFGYCDDVLIDGVSIQNNLMVPNSDGLHITVSRNVRISNCDIRAGDDAIVITGFAKIENRPGFTSEEQDRYTHGNKTPYAENIQVSNCHLQSRSSGIRVGYGQHPIRRFVFTNIVIYGSNRGIGIFARDAADIEELVFSNIIIDTRLHSGQWWGQGEPIHLSALSRFEGEPVGRIRDVQFNNVVATAEQGILVYGHETYRIEDIRFTNVQLRLHRGPETLAYGGNFDLRPAADPALRVFEHDVPGLHARHVDRLALRDFRLAWGDNLPAFFTHGIECVDVAELRLDGVAVAPNPGSGSEALKLERTSRAP